MLVYFLFRFFFQILSLAAISIYKVNLVIIHNSIKQKVNLGLNQFNNNNHNNNNRKNDDDDDDDDDDNDNISNMLYSAGKETNVVGSATISVEQTRTSGFGQVKLVKIFAKERHKR